MQADGNDGQASAADAAPGGIDEHARRSDAGGYGDALGGGGDDAGLWRRATAAAAAKAVRFARAEVEDQFAAAGRECPSVHLSLKFTATGPHGERFRCG